MSFLTQTAAAGDTSDASALLSMSVELKPNHFFSGRTTYEINSQTTSGSLVEDVASDRTNIYFEINSQDV